MGWNQVRLACFLPCALAAAGEPESMGGDRGGDTCAAATSCGEQASCPRGACSEMASEETSPSPEGDATGPACAEAATFPCGLAFCLDGPTGGDGVPAGGSAPQPDPPSVFIALVPEPAALPEAPARGGWTLDASDDFPASPTRASFHQARAPPASA